MKILKKLLALVFAVLLLLCLAGCGNKNAGLTPKEYQEIIDDHIDGTDPTETLIIGEEHRAWGAVGLNKQASFMHKVFSSDESVVTVSSSGKVTAVGEGVAYVIIAEKLPILGVIDYDCSKYTVLSPETAARNTAVEDWDRKVLVVGEQANGPTDSRVYSCDESVIAVSDNGALLAVGPGVTRVVYAESNHYSVLEYTVYGDWYQKMVALEEIPSNETVADDYYTNQFNCLTLTVGQTHTIDDFFTINHQYKYSTDETVVAVSEDNVILAVSEGTAYIVFATSNDMFDAYKVTVTVP